MGLGAVLLGIAALILGGATYSFRYVLLAKLPPPPKMDPAMVAARRATLDRMAVQLDLIEAELRRLGWWLDSPEPPSELEPSKLFAGLTFPQWLQYEFLPHARTAIRADALPASSNVGLAAMRQYDYHSTVPEALPLVRLLYQFDDLFSLARHGI
jgi:uncharacterized protein YqcC (DUF446 family)